MDIKEITDSGRNASSVIGDLKKKSVFVPSWAKLEKEYNPMLHPVMTDKNYSDKTNKKGEVERMTRTILGWQKLAVKRMGELLFGLPVTRVYKPKDEAEESAAAIMEGIFRKNRIDSVNLERAKNLYASCENVTIWYTQETPAIYGGASSPLKLRCKNFSPKDGAAIYPLFDEYDDLIALSVEYTRIDGDETWVYFDTYTAEEHIRWSSHNGELAEDLREAITIGKIAGVYINRPEPIWEDQSGNVYEAEWTLSRNGNYIRKNARPNWVVFADEKVGFGNEPIGSNEGRNVLQYPANAKAEYVTWQQATESIKFQIDELKKQFFLQLQLPDMSMDNLKTSPMSGEARKMMFIDAQMKAGDESGIWLEAFDREVNVVRAFAKVMFPNLEAAFDSLEVENVINVYQIRDDAEKITNLINATGGKAVMSQKTAIQYLGWADNVDDEMKQIAEESTSNLFDEPAM